MNEHVAGWRIAAQPAQDGDDWSVVFRMDDLAPDTAGPRIVVTAMAWSETEEIEVIDEDDEPEIGYSGVTVFAGYEVVGPDGKVVTRYEEQNPSWCVIESDWATIDSARMLPRRRYGSCLRSLGSGAGTARPVR